MCVTISKLWRDSKKASKKSKEKSKVKFYTFKEFVTLHNSGKLDTAYYNGNSVCLKATPVVTPIPIIKHRSNLLPIACACFIIGGTMLGLAIANE